MPGTQRQLKKEQTREKILAAALEQFAALGLTKASTAGIAQVAGVSHGAVFAHFATLEQLQQAAIEEFGRQVSTRLHELVTDGQGLRQVLAAHLQALQEHEQFYARLVMEGRLLAKDTRYVLIGIQSVMAHHIGQAAQRAMEEGRIRTMPMHLLFNTWVGLVHHYLVNDDLYAPGESVLHRYGQQLLDYYLGLLQQTSVPKA